MQKKMFKRDRDKERILTRQDKTVSDRKVVKKLYGYGCKNSAWGLNW